MTMTVRRRVHAEETTEGRWEAAPQRQADHDQGETVWSLFAGHAQEHPEQAAIIDGDDEIDYRRLAQRASAIAGELAARGVEPGALVGVCMSRTWQLPATLLGVLRAGCAYVPLDPAYPRERVRYMVQHARLGAAVVDHETMAELCQGVPELLRLDEVAEVGEIRESTADATVDAAAGPAPRDLAYVIYTSGSTGRPKGVAIEHRSVVALSGSMRALLSDDELAGVLAAASVCFDASVMEILGTLSLGGTVVLAENPLQLLELPAADRVRMCVMVPSALKVLLAAGRLPEGIRCVVVGAEVLTASLVSQLHAQDPGRRVINVYGPTEDTVYSTTAGVAVGAETITIGTSVPGSRSYILDDNLQPVPAGVEGELYLAGNKLARGYLHDEELTTERFLEMEPSPSVPEARLYKTGDLCRLREDGEIEFLGRIDQQVKIRGHRIELEEIESTLEAMDGVDCAAAAAVDGPGGQQMLVGYVVSRSIASRSVTSRSAETGEAARAYLAERLPGYMVPQVVMVLDDLPRLPNDKLDRKRLPKPDLGRRQDSAAHAGETALVQSLARLSQSERHAALLSAIQREIASLLRLENAGHVRPDDLLDDLGLDSLTRVELGSRLGAVIDRKLPVSELMQRSTPAALADYLLGVTGTGHEKVATENAQGRAADTLGSFQTQIQGCYPPFLAGKAAAWSATDKGTLVRELKRLVSRPGDPFCKLVRTGSGHRGVVADVDTERAREAIIWTTNLYLGLNRDPEVIAEARSAVERFGTGMGTSAAASGITDIHLE
ncbi:MAG: amino acid adenylation domain-containing protein, partial [Acidobacteriota bacterium]